MALAQAGWAVGQWADLVCWQFLLNPLPSLLSPHDLHPCRAPLSILGFGKNPTKNVTIFGRRELTGFRSVSELRKMWSRNLDQSAMIPSANVTSMSDIALNPCLGLYQISKPLEI